MAGMAGTYLAYCDCVRKGSGEKLSIVAAFTGGDSDNLIVGRNGIFYDRAGRDWDATITKIVDNPISIRQAFWSPYKKLVRMIEERAAKQAAAAEAGANAQLTAVANTPLTPPAAAATPGAAAKPAFDPSVVALLSLAFGALATAFAGILAFLGKFEQWQVPLVIIGIMLVISAPSMAIAWLKLRKRNLGPILDANGWAVNAKARMNVPFGGALTGGGGVAARLDFRRDGCVCREASGVAEVADRRVCDLVYLGVPERQGWPALQLDRRLSGNTTICHAAAIRSRTDCQGQIGESQEGQGGCRRQIQKPPAAAEATNAPSVTIDTRRRGSVDL